MQADGWSCFAFTAGYKSNMSRPAQPSAILPTEQKALDLENNLIFRRVQQLKAPAREQQSHSNSQVRQLQHVI